MTSPESTPTTPPQDNKELNFRILEQKYQRQLDQERQARLELEKRFAESQQKQAPVSHDDDDDDEPYVNKKKLANQFASFEKKFEERIDQRAEQKARYLIKEEKQQNWLKNNSDFDEVMQHADKLVDLDKELADSILSIPDPFERQKLAYKNIKALGLHKDKPREPSIQEKIDSNRKGAFYQPANVGAPPYASSSDFSKKGQKDAYDRMQELKNRMRL